MKLFQYSVSFMRFYHSFQTNYYPFVTHGKKSLITFLLTLISYFLYFGKKHTHTPKQNKQTKLQKEAAVCGTCHALVTVKQILLECADLTEIKKIFFEENSVNSLFRNVRPERLLTLLNDTGALYNILSVLWRSYVKVFIEDCCS